MQPGPMATFPKWKELGRYVRKGEKAITLCQPVTVTRTRPVDVDAETTEPGVFTRFVYRPHWFVLAQTDGAEIPAGADADVGRRARVVRLDVTEVPSTRPTATSWVRPRAVDRDQSRSTRMPHKTRFHELAHVLLGHTSEGPHADGDITPRNLRECEAEAVALLCLAALDLPGIEQCRGYIQHWWGAGPIPERSAQRILKVADQILKAGSTSTEAQS